MILKWLKNRRRFKKSEQYKIKAPHHKEPYDHNYYYIGVFVDQLGNYAHRFRSVNPFIASTYDIIDIDLDLKYWLVIKSKNREEIKIN